MKVPCLIAALALGTFLPETSAWNVVTTALMTRYSLGSQLGEIEYLFPTENDNNDWQSMFNEYEACAEIEDPNRPDRLDLDYVTDMEDIENKHALINRYKEKVLAFLNLSLLATLNPLNNDQNYDGYDVDEFDPMVHRVYNQDQNQAVVANAAENLLNRMYFQVGSLDGDTAAPEEIDVCSQLLIDQNSAIYDQRRAYVNLFYKYLDTPTCQLLDADCQTQYKNQLNDLTNFYNNL